MRTAGNRRGGGHRGGDTGGAPPPTPAALPAGAARPVLPVRPGLLRPGGGRAGAAGAAAAPGQRGERGRAPGTPGIRAHSVPPAGANGERRFTCRRGNTASRDRPRCSTWCTAGKPCTTTSCGGTGRQRRCPEWSSSGTASKEWRRGVRGVAGEAPYRQRPWPLLASFTPFFLLLLMTISTFFSFSTCCPIHRSQPSPAFSVPHPPLRKVVSIYPCLIAGYLLLS